MRGLTEVEKQEFNRVWHKLDPWPDAVAGIERVRRRYTVAALSNGCSAAASGVGEVPFLPTCVLDAFASSGAGVGR